MEEISRASSNEGDAWVRLNSLLSADGLHTKLFILIFLTLFGCYPVSSIWQKCGNGLKKQTEFSYWKSRFKKYLIHIQYGCHKKYQKWDLVIFNNETVFKRLRKSKK